MTDKSPEAIAKTLSETMCNALAHAYKKHQGHRVLSPYTEDRTRRALQSRGLITRGNVLNETGIAVRDLILTDERYQP